ncbi:hypothetical protein NMY22_g18893 [Coprinellus aureogranulatus]|nr:hypothetical protein NMY22_g18893 [Coprinellus aureogranulatus]
MTQHLWSRWLGLGRGQHSAQPEFTARAVFIGLGIGCLICFTNLSLGLQSGWISMMSIQSALIGFLISRMLPSPLSPQEIIVVQTTAVATGTMPLAAGFVGILPALGLLSEERDGTPPIHLTWLSAAAWSCAVAFFGVFLSPPLRKQVIIEEELPFPSGTATAHLISRGYRAMEEEEAPRPSTEAAEVVQPEDEEGENEREFVQHEGWFDLAWSFGFAGALTLFAYFFPVVFTIPLFGAYLAKEWLWYFTPSLSYVGQGIIMGFPTTVSMNLGMFVGWAVLSPLSKLSGWAPGPVGDMSNGARGWILWVALGIMCTDSLVSLVPVVWEFVSDAMRPLRSSYARIDDDRPTKRDREDETSERLVPRSWVSVGLSVSIVMGTILVWLVFGHEGIKPWATVIGFFLGGLLSVIGVRALGETDLNPVSGLGKISQLLFAWLQPGNIVANIIAGGVAEAGAQQSDARPEDWAPVPCLTSSAVLRPAHRLIGLHLSDDHGVHAV